MAAYGLSGLSWRLPFQIRCHFWPLMASLVLAIVTLQVLHMALLSRLEAKEAHGKDGGAHAIGGGRRRQLQGRMLKTVLAEMEERVRRAYRLDKSGTYHLLDNFLTSEHVVAGGRTTGGRGSRDVSIVTQCSSNHLHHLVELSERWKGPISVAVFTHDDDNFISTAYRLVHLHFCNDHIFRLVSFHLVYPISRAPKHFTGLSDITLDCSAFDTIIGTGDQSKGQVPNLISLFWENEVNNGGAAIGSKGGLNDGGKGGDAAQLTNYSGLEYPNNLLRNLAINYAQTPYIFLVDIDMVPSENLRAQFQDFMSDFFLKWDRGGSAGEEKSNSLQLQAFVVPVFEVQKSLSQLPSNKKDLLDALDAGLVRPFYWEVCQKCQWPTDYNRWRELGHGSNGPLRIGYAVERVDPWEPFYIAKNTLPLYDERFKQYGFNRISQVRNDTCVD